VDASVVTKWYIIEEDFEKAVRIRDLHLSGRLTLSSPLLVVYEVGNALGKHPAFTESDSAKAFQSLLDVGLQLRSFAESKLLGESFKISRQLQLTFYDATYVALAKEYDAMLVTADRNLCSKIERHCRTELLGEMKPEELAE